MRSNAQVILAPDRQLVSVFVQAERFDKETAAKVGLPLYLNVWIKQATLTESAQPRMIWRGYNGSQMEYQQLPNGRIIVPYGSFQPHAKAVPPTGRHMTIIQTSDDGGRRWLESKSKMVAPCYTGFNGSNGYKHYGPAKRWWRSRAVGCELIANPTDSTSQCLHLRKADSLPADGATWNFPNGWKGSITARMMIREGYHGGVISLNKRMFDPANDYGEEFAVFQVGSGADGSIGNTHLQPDKWHDVRLEWDLSRSKCLLLVDNEPAGEVPLRNKTLNGISYIRFRSAARQIDTAGFLVDRVTASIDDPSAPPCSVIDQREQERRYIKNVVPHWR